MLQLYENIRKFRKQRHWTQKELADKVGYENHSVISKIERGEIQDLPTSKILDFARAFNVTPGELMGNDGCVPDAVQLTARERRLLDYYRLCSPDQKDMIDKLMGI